MTDWVGTTDKLVTLAWHDIEPKLVAALGSGAAVGFVLSILAAYHIVVPTPVEAVLQLLAVAAGGYIKKTDQQAVPKAPKPPKPPLPTAADVAAE